MEDFPKYLITAFFCLPKLVAKVRKLDYCLLRPTATGSQTEYKTNKTDLLEFCALLPLRIGSQDEGNWVCAKHSFV
jgi:hypothetical protein